MSSKVLSISLIKVLTCLLISRSFGKRSKYLHVINAKSLEANFLESYLLMLRKVAPAELKGSTRMHEAKVMHKDLTLSCCGHLALMQFRPVLYHLASNQGRIQ